AAERPKIGSVCSVIEPLSIKERNTHGTRPPPAREQTQLSQSRSKAASGQRRSGHARACKAGRPPPCCPFATFCCRLATPPSALALGGRIQFRLRSTRARCLLPRIIA